MEKVEANEKKERAKKGANGDAPPRPIIRNGKKRWEGQLTIYYEDNKQKRKSYSGATQKEALAKKKELQAKILAKVNLLETKNKTTATYVKEFLDNALNDIRESTMNNYNSYYRNHIAKSELGSTLFEEVKKRHLEVFIKELLDKELKASMIHNIFKPLKLAFEYAKEENHISINPIKKIRLPKIEEDTDIITFTVEEIEKIKKETVKNQYHLAFRILFHGLRISELLGIAWSDISFENNTIYINKQIYFATGKEAALVNLKTTSSKRYIPISDEIMELLIQHKQKQDNTKKLNKSYNNLNLVFTSKSGKAVRQYLFRTVFYTMLRKLGIEHHTVHNARHSFCSIALERMNPKEVCELVGHSNISVTNRYLHGNNEKKRAKLLALNL